MKIFYTASFWGKDKYQRYYDLVREALEKTKVELISPEKGNYLDLVSKSEAARLGNAKMIHYEAIRRGIEWADAVVMEVSNEDFQLGHEATLAMQAKKHVLCLSIHEDFSVKINDRYFHGAKYNENSVWWTVEEFINGVRGNVMSERLNMFLSVNQLKYVAQVSAKSGVNKSEYIRRLIEHDQKRSVK